MVKRLLVFRSQPRARVSWSGCSKGVPNVFCRVVAFGRYRRLRNGAWRADRPRSLSAPTETLQILRIKDQLHLARRGQLTPRATGFASACRGASPVEYSDWQARG